MKYMQRVEKGIKFLDSVYGRKWKKKVNLEKLDMGVACDCILGQTDTDYDAHADKLGLTFKQVQDYGFFDEEGEWAHLTEVWKQALSSPKTKQKGI